MRVERHHVTMMIFVLGCPSTRENRLPQHVTRITGAIFCRRQSIGNRQKNPTKSQLPVLPVFKVSKQCGDREGVLSWADRTQEKRER